MLSIVCRPEIDNIITLYIVSLLLSGGLLISHNLYDTTKVMNKKIHWVSSHYKLYLNVGYYKPVLQKNFQLFLFIVRGICTL